MGGGHRLQEVVAVAAVALGVVSRKIVRGAVPASAV